ncbi:MAG: ion channel, partial [Coprothermobacterota bacterium]|nr:ion channel [Coprothermobacterota bacterium]
MDRKLPNSVSTGSPLPETTTPEAGGPAKSSPPYVYRPRTHPLVLLVVMVFYMITTLAWGLQGLPARLVWASLGTLIPLVSVGGLRGEKTRLLRVLGVLGALQIAVLWINCIIPTPSTALIESIVSTVFYGYLTVLLVSYLARSRQVDANTIYAAATVFLLLGVAWANVHHLIALIFPGSYSAGMTATDYLYFSFTTLTTTGFGDILALTSLARLATMLEEVMGTLYVAILIGRIVGITVSNAPRHEDPP